MDQTLDCLDRLERKVLVELVKLVQKRRMRGTLGVWKDFLNLHDKKFGSSVSDPSRRSDYELSSFLKTFNKEKHLKFIEEALQSHMNRDSVEQSKDIIPADESPEQILESEKAMLLLHKIPISVPSEELHRVVPGDFNFAVRVKNDQLKANARGRNYCAVVIFSNPQEADQAFENVNGKPEKDSAGLPQKLIEFQFDAGITTELYVRKMARDNPYEVWRKKRVLLFQGKENSGESKKLNTEQKIKEEISGESKKLKTEQEIKEEEISCESKKLKTARDNPYEVWRKKRVLLFQGKENSGESKKLNTEQKTKEEISGESKKLKTEQEIKEEEISCESTKLKTARDNPYEVWRKKRVLLFQGKENSGESKKLNTEQKTKKEISGESKKLKTEQEIKEEEISCESKKLKTARDNPYEVWRKKRVLLFQGKENSGESKKLNTEQKIKEEISGESKKLKTEQEIREEEISCESKKLKTARDNPYEVWRKKRVLLFQGKENSGESKKLNTEQKIKEEISGESKKLKTEQEIKEEISGESKKLKTQQEIKEEIMVDSNQSNCDDHLKEIESSRQEVSENDFQISTQDKIISEPRKKVRRRRR